MLFSSLPSETQNAIEGLIPSFLDAEGFDLNLIGLSLARAVGRTLLELQVLFQNHCVAGCEPVRNALARLSIPIPHGSSFTPNPLDAEEDAAEY